MHHEMSKQCESIRDFWRNTLVEAAVGVEKWSGKQC